MGWAYPSQSDVDFNPIPNARDFVKDVVLPTVTAKEKDVEKEPDYEVVWEPIKGSSQELAITSPAHHTLYCGARGPGR